MKKLIFCLVILSLLAASCAPASGRCGDGKCDGPENASNCAKDCTVPGGVTDTEAAPSNNTNGSDLSKVVEMTVTTSTTAKGSGMTVTGVISLDLDFPSAGGEAVLTMGSVKITDYAWEEIAGCKVKIPDDLVGASQSISFKSIQYTPGEFMIFEAPIQYEAKNYEVVLECTNGTSTPMTEQPFYKVFGLFNEKYKSLSFKPEDGFNNTFPWGKNDAFSSQVSITVK